MPTFNLLECNCFTTRKVARRLSQIYDAKLAPCGIKSTQLVVLSALESGPLTVKDLAKVMVLDRTAIGKSVKPMERDGYVKTTVCEADKRSYTVALTAKGKSLLARAYPLWKSAHDEFQRTHGPEFSEQYRKMLTHVLDAAGADS